LDFVFNGWGGKFPAELDNGVTRRLHEHGAYGDACFETIEFVLEGGAIDTDGAGTLLTTSQCLLTSTRNGGLTQRQIEEMLLSALGLDRVLWLNHGYLAGDDTDSHVDTLARFCDASTIAYVKCSNPDDEHYESLGAMEAELTALRTADGLPYRLVPLPLPTACFDEHGARLPATYANFLIINGAVLAPVYGVPEDAEALTRLTNCFPDRKIVDVPCRTLIEQHGSLHCVTMQIPKGVVL
jgi:agmatine deiminase